MILRSNDPYSVNQVFTLCRPSLTQKEFNEILQQRKGEKRPESDLLKLTTLYSANLKVNLTSEKTQKNDPPELLLTMEKLFLHFL